MPPRITEIVAEGYNKNSSRIYFCNLLNAIIGEYRESGRCEYVDSLLRNPPKNIDAVEFSVLSTLQEIFFGRFVPYISVVYQGSRSSSLDWDYLHKRNEYPISFSRQTDYLLRDIQRYAPSLQAPAARDSRDNEWKVFQSPAKREENRVRQEAVQYAEDAKKQADQEALRIRAKALKEREQLLDDALKEREQLLAKAREEADRIRKQSAAEQKEAQRAAAASSGLGRFWQDCQHDLLREVENVIAQDNARAQDAMAQINDTHDQMREITSDLKANWYVALDENIRRLKDMQADLDKNMSTWQQSLYPRELTPLAQCYTQLSVLISRSNVFTEELAARSGPSKPFGASEDACAPTTLEELRRLWTNLVKFQAQFEKSLGGLGMYAFSPGKGEPFDEFFHSPSTDIDTSGQLTIKRCVTPGVLRRTKRGEEEEEVIIPAVVELEER